MRFMGELYKQARASGSLDRFDAIEKVEWQENICEQRIAFALQSKRRADPPDPSQQRGGEMKQSFSG